LKHIKIFSGNDDEVVKCEHLDGVISVVAQICPQPFLEYFYNKNSKPLEDILPLIQAVFKEVNPQGIKAAWSIMGYDSMDLRLPMVKASEANYEAIRSQIASLENYKLLNNDFSLLS
jgi:dihydrodipicolinate synthase/N-acetylneuraminate lyase